jgi:sugar O-acyltransferase (sialic acid O-acetyltransferase NeuD family)
MPTEFFIIGAGGHGKVVLEALVNEGKSVQVYDADPKKTGGLLLNHEIKFYSVDLTDMPAIGHIAIGNNSLRLREQRRVTDAGLLLASIVHPQSVVSPSASLGQGVFIGANAIVGPDVEVARGTIINHAAVVDHDCSIGRCCHIAPNATIGGGVCIGNEVLIGSGATVLPGLTISDGALIAAGSVVTKNVNRSQLVMGVPAKVKE